MKKFMKYEIKGTYKFILGLLAIIILASSIIQFNILNQVNNMGSDQSSLLAFLVLLSVLVLFGAFIVLLFYLINSFRKELYEDRGYLTFTLPLTGNQIVGSKMIIAIMWSGVVGFVTVAYNAILYLILFSNEYMNEIASGILAEININFFVALFISLVSSIVTILIIYFSISLSKVSIKNKKIGGFWFILFLIISGAANYITNLLGNILPYYLNLETLKIATIGNVQEALNVGMLQFSFGMNNSAFSAVFPGYLNIPSFIGQILFGVLFFIGTGYLLEKRIEL